MVRALYDGRMARPMKKPARFEMRLSPEEESLLNLLSEKMGIPKANIMSLALRAFARRERVQIPTAEALAKSEGGE